MSNKKFVISEEAHNVLLDLNAILDIEKNPITIKLAIAKGISISPDLLELNIFDKKGGWTVPQDIIKGHDYLLFKHLVIQECGKNLSDDELTSYFAFYLETGLRILYNLTHEKVALEDAKLAILE